MGEISTSKLEGIEKIHRIAHFDLNGHKYSPSVLIPLLQLLQQRQMIAQQILETNQWDDGLELIEYVNKEIGKLIHI